MEIARALLEFTGTDPLSRSSLPKGNSSKKFDEVNNVVNNLVMSNCVEEANILDSLHTLIYCRATAMGVIGIRMRTSKPPKSVRADEMMPPLKRRLRVKID